MAEALVAHETLSSDQIDALMAGEALPPSEPTLDGGDGPPPQGQAGPDGPAGTRARVGPPVVQHFVHGLVGASGERN
jgi:hypothetical protein